MPDTAYTRTFRRAIKTLGTPKRLARVLGASVAEVRVALGHRELGG